MKNSIYILCGIILIGGNLNAHPMFSNTVSDLERNTKTNLVLDIGENSRYDHYLARCTNIKFQNKSSSFGKTYYNYVVKCSNGRQANITAWDDRKKWCVGKSTKKEDCADNQMKAATMACNR
jgi:hypothetical protein